MCITLRIEKSLPRDTADTPLVSGMDEVQYLLEAKSDLCARGLKAKNSWSGRIESFTLCGHEQVAIDLIARIL